MAIYEFKEEYVSVMCCGVAMAIDGNSATCAKCGARKEVKSRLVKDDNGLKSALGNVGSAQRTM